VRKWTWLGVGVLVLSLARPALALDGCLSYYLRRHPDLCAINKQLAGHVFDFTNNHGTDRRIWSPALGEKRDLYVYVPPGYDPHLRYPVILYLHGFGQDETSFLDLVRYFDQAVRQGQLPPTVIAVPDGSINGRPALYNAGSFWVNSRAGRFEDYVMHDVWGLVTATFPVRPERQAHVLVGASMGGFGAYNLAIKYRDCFGTVVGFFPPINPRYVDCRGRYFPNFDPNCVGWREQLHPHRPIARFGPLVIRERRLIDPLYGRGPDAIGHIARENPSEMLFTFDVKPGDLEMFIAYGGRDEFNIDAQVESFLYLASQRGLTVTWVKDPEAKHNTAAGIKLFPYMVEWLGPRMAPFGPQ
jgi:pimeloyl-ACP methyl ester carboxylesterase